MALNRRISGILVLSVILLGSQARAQTAAGPVGLDDAKAKLYAEAIAAMEAKDWPTCRVKGLGVFVQSQHPQVAALLGLCEEALGMNREAAEHLDIARSGDDHSHAGRSADIEAAWERVQAKVTILKIKINVAGAKVTVNGQDASISPLQKLYVEPGKVTIKVSLAGYDEQMREVQGSAGFEQEVSFVLVNKEDGGRAVWPAILLGIAGGGGVVAGATLLGLGAVANGDRGDKLTALGGDSPCGSGTPHTTECADIADLADRYKTFTVAGGITLGVGGAAALAALLYGVIPGPAGGAASPTSALVLPALGPDMTGVIVHGSFW